MHVCSVVNAKNHQHHHHNLNNLSNHPKAISWNHSDPNTVCYRPKLAHAVHFNPNTITTIAMVFAMYSVTAGAAEIRINSTRPKIVNRNVAMYKICAVYRQFVVAVKRM